MSIIYRDKNWEYRGFKCSIEFDHEEDNVKAFHYVETHDGKTTMLDISPYDRNEKTVEALIDNKILFGEYEGVTNG